MSAKQALVILAEGFEELEAVAPVDILRRAGVEVIMASVGENLMLDGRNGVHISADMLLPTALERSYDLIVLPGGPGHKQLRADRRVLDCVRCHAEAGRLVAAICAAPVVLKDAGLLEGRRHTAHVSVEEELPQLIKDEAVVIDGNIITSRGAGTAVDLGLALVAQLFDAGTAAKIASDIHFRP